MDNVENLAIYKNFITNGQRKWPEFFDSFTIYKEQINQVGGGSEGIAERRVEDLFVTVLGWSKSNINYQVGRSDLLISRSGIKRCIIETKRPGALKGNIHKINQALAQARRYADKQGVNIIAASDGLMLHAADIKGGGLIDRLSIDLSGKIFPKDLWWLSLKGIDYNRDNYNVDLSYEPIANTLNSDKLLHKTYKLPACCFAYVPDANNEKTWKLPYLKLDRNVDSKRLPGAINAIVKNYRGNHVEIPPKDIPYVLKHLEKAAREIDKMPDQNPKTACCYIKLQEILDQLAR